MGNYVKKDWSLDTFHKGDKEFIDGLNHLEEGVAEGGGSGPSQYLKDAIKNGSILIITKNDGTTVEYTGGEPAAFLKDAVVNAEKLTITKKDGSIIELDISNKANQTDLDLEKDARVNADAELQEYIEAKQDKLTAGTNITIDENNVISATGGGSGNVDSITVGGEKLLPENKDVKIVLGNSLAYSDQEPGVAYKNLHVNFKSTHGLEIDGTNGLKVKINKTAGTLFLDAAGLKVTEGKFVEVPTEPVEGQGVNVPYYFDVNYGPDKATVNDYTIDLLNKARAPRQFSLDINGASSTTAGLMSAANFNKVENFGNLIPDQASADNKLADKNFVNSTVQTSTAIFRGNFANKAALDAYVGEKKLNDYAVVQADETHENQSWRYKYNGSLWIAEYKINDSAFTAAQLAAINSGVTSDKVSLYDSHINNTDIHVTADQKTTWDAKQNAISDLDDIRTKANTAVQPAAISDMATKYWVEQQRYLKEHQDISGKQDKLTAGDNITIDVNNKISAADQLPAYPTDTESEYVLALKYVDGAWVKYWKETVNKSDVVDSGMVDYMVLKQ